MVGWDKMAQLPIRKSVQNEPPPTVSVADDGPVGTLRSPPGSREPAPISDVCTFGREIRDTAVIHPSRHATASSIPGSTEADGSEHVNDMAVRRFC
jgi:hypothetical protein